MGQILSSASRRLVVIVAFAMSLAILALSSPDRALAFDGNGAGTSGSPYQITTCALLNSIDLDLAAYYVLSNDIDCNGAGAGWSPIGTSGGGFTGTLDGQGHKVTDLDLSGISNSTNFAGMFSTIKSTAVVKNLSIINGKINGGNNIGMVAGGLYNTASLDNVYVQATVTCHAENCGGLVGSQRNASVINDSGADVTVSSEGQTTGGLVGWIADTGTIQESFANGHITGTYYVGGLVGAVNNIGSPATITNSYANTTVVAAFEYAGGIAGLGVKLNLTNAYAVGSVSGSDNIGGLVGLFFGHMGETFAANTITGTGGAVGPVTGNFAGGTVGNRYFDVTITGFASSPDGSSPITDSDYFINNSSNPPMNTWNFSTMWRTNYANYPSFAPKTDPYMLCEEPHSTDTTMSGHCDVLPLGWGTPTWEARWSLHGANQWHAIVLSDTHQAIASVSGLTPGTEYDLQFRYTNDFGVGPWGTLGILTTGTAPITPTTISANTINTPVSFATTGYGVPESTAENASASPASSNVSTPTASSASTTPSFENETPTNAESDNAKDTMAALSISWYWFAGGLIILITIGLFFGFRFRTKT